MIELDSCRQQAFALVPRPREDEARIFHRRTETNLSIALISLSQTLQLKPFFQQYRPPRGFVKSQFFPKDDHAGMSWVEIGHELPDKSIQFLHVNSRSLCCTHFDPSPF
jgi:hypothetical protein